MVLNVCLWLALLRNTRLTCCTCECIWQRINPWNSKKHLGLPAAPIFCSIMPMPCQTILQGKWQLDDDMMFQFITMPTWWTENILNYINLLSVCLICWFQRIQLCYVQFRNVAKYLVMSLFLKQSLFCWWHLKVQLLLYISKQKLLCFCFHPSIFCVSGIGRAFELFS